jgi:hypothetical protein
MKPVFSSLLLLWLLWIAVVSRGADAETKRPDLRGVVQSTNGQPIAGASVFIYTAGPKLGVGFL